MVHIKKFHCSLAASHSQHSYAHDLLGHSETIIEIKNEKGLRFTILHERTVAATSSQVYSLNCLLLCIVSYMSIGQVSPCQFKIERHILSINEFVPDFREFGGFVSMWGTFANFL
jgi:hypothetical protein